MPRFHTGLCTAILFTHLICSQSASRFLEKQEAQAYIHAAKAPIKAPAAKAPAPIKALEAKPNFFGAKFKTQTNSKSSIDSQAWFESDLMAEGASVETKAKVESKVAPAKPLGKHPAATEWFEIDETPWVGDATASDANGHHFVIKAESKTKHVAASHAHSNHITTKHTDSSIDSHLKKAAESDSDVAEMLKFEKSAESESGDAEGNDKAPEVESSDDATSLPPTHKSTNIADDDDDDAEESVHLEKDLSRAVAIAASALSPTNTLAAPDVDSKSTARAEHPGTYDDSWHNKAISLAHYDSISHDDHTLHEDDEHFPLLLGHDAHDGSAHDPQDDHLPPLPKHLQGNVHKLSATMHSDYEDYSDDGSESFLAMGDLSSHGDFQYDENAHDKVHAYDDHSMDMGDVDDLTHDHYSDDSEHDHNVDVHDDHFPDDGYDSDHYDDEDPGL